MKIFLLSIVFILFFSCSTNKTNLNTIQPSGINKINGKYFAYIKNDEIKIEKDDIFYECRDWEFKKNLIKDYTEKIEVLIIQMFKNVTIINNKNDFDKIDNHQFQGGILIIPKKLVTQTKIKNNQISFNINILTNLKFVKDKKELTKSNLKANSYGKKKIFLTCDFEEIINNSIINVYRESLNLIKETIYDGIYKISKKESYN